MAETLNSEQIIETDTRDIIEQIALDFKLALQAVDEAVDKIKISSEPEVLNFSKAELNRMHKWFNMIIEMNVDRENEYLIYEEDESLYTKIKNLIE